MNEQDFWTLIDENVSSTIGCDLDLSALQAALSSRQPDEIVAFAAVFDRLYSASYSWSLWGAAYLINGGCGDDGFDDFRAWLIGAGRTVFEAAVANPDSLVDVAWQGVGCEDMLSVADDAYEVATGSEDMPRSYDPRPDLGEEWDFDCSDEMRARYPRLFAKFGD